MPATKKSTPFWSSETQINAFATISSTAMGSLIFNLAPGLALLAALSIFITFFVVKKDLIDRKAELGSEKFGDLMRRIVVGIFVLGIIAGGELAVLLAGLNFDDGLIRVRVAAYLAAIAGFLIGVFITNINHKRK